MVSGDRGKIREEYEGRTFGIQNRRRHRSHVRDVRDDEPQVLGEEVVTSFALERGLDVHDRTVLERELQTLTGRDVDVLDRPELAIDELAEGSGNLVSAFACVSRRDDASKTANRDCRYGKTRNLIHLVSPPVGVVVVGELDHFDRAYTVYHLSIFVNSAVEKL